MKNEDRKIFSCWDIVPLEKNANCTVALKIRQLPTGDVWLDILRKTEFIMAFFFCKSDRSKALRAAHDMGRMVGTDLQIEVEELSFPPKRDCWALTSGVWGAERIFVTPKLRLALVPNQDRWELQMSIPAGHFLSFCTTGTIPLEQTIAAAGRLSSLLRLPKPFIDLREEAEPPC